MKWAKLKAFIRARKSGIIKSVGSIIISLIPVSDKLPKDTHRFISAAASSLWRNLIDWLDNRDDKVEQFGLVIAVLAVAISIGGVAAAAGPLFFVWLSRVAMISGVLFQFINLTQDYPVRPAPAEGMVDVN